MLTLEVAGEFEKDVAHGHGIRYYPNGEVYQGGWLHGAKHGVGVVECQLEEEQDSVQADSSHASSAAAENHTRPGRATIKRVTSHAHFQLEVTDDEEDMSHNSKHSEDAELASLRADVAHRRAVTRQESTSSIKSASSFGGGATPLAEGWGGGGGMGAMEAGSIAHGKAFMKRVVSRRCIDGVPLDELASQLPGNLGGAAISDDADDAVEACECEALMETQAVQRYEEDLKAARSEYYSELNRTAEHEAEDAADMSPDLTPKHSPSGQATVPSPMSGQLGSSLHLSEAAALLAMPPLSGALADGDGVLPLDAVSEGAWCDTPEHLMPARGHDSESTSSGALTPEEMIATAADA